MGAPVARQTGRAVTDQPHPIYRRHPTLVAAILDHVTEAEHPVPWLELVDRHTDRRYGWKTIENVLYELIGFGALHKLGDSRRGQPDRRALRPTALGQAWINQELLPFLSRDPDATPPTT